MRRTVSEVEYEDIKVCGSLGVALYQPCAASHTHSFLRVHAQKRKSYLRATAPAEGGLCLPATLMLSRSKKLKSSPSSLSSTNVKADPKPAHRGFSHKQAWPSVSFFHFLWPHAKLLRAP